MTARYCVVQLCIVYTAYPLQVTGKLEPIPADFECKVGYMLDRFQSIVGITQRRKAISITPIKNLEPGNLICMSVQMYRLNMQIEDTEPETFFLILFVCLILSFFILDIYEFIIHRQKNNAPKTEKCIKVLEIKYFGKENS